MKPSATVQLPISAFRDRVRDFDGDSDGLAEWIRNFSKALSETNPELEDFAGRLLNEVVDYRKKESLRIQALQKKKKSDQAQEQSNNADADPGDKTSITPSQIASSAPASATSDGAAGPRGNPEQSSPREGVLEPLPPQQPHAGKPRRPSPDMLRGYTIPEMGEVWDFVHEKRIPESVASEWYAWNEEIKWPPLKKGWKAALRGFAKKKEE